MRVILFLLIALVSGSGYAFGEEGDAIRSSRLLLESARKLDGQRLSFKGEAIAFAMNRGTSGWINVADEYGALGVWMKASQISSVGNFGSYRHKGDILLISGVFHRACAEHGGDMDIHSDSVAVLESGGVTDRDVNFSRIAVGLILSAAAIASLVIGDRTRHTRRQTKD